MADNSTRPIDSAAFAHAITNGILDDYLDEFALDFDAEQWTGLADAAVRLHQEGAIDLVKAVASGDGHPGWAVERLYDAALPNLRLSIEQWLEAIGSFDRRSRGGIPPYFVITRFSEWCEQSPERVHSALEAIREGRVPTSMLIATMKAGLRSDYSRWRTEFIETLRSHDATWADAAAHALGEERSADRSVAEDTVVELRGALEPAPRERRRPLILALLRHALSVDTDKVVAHLAFEAVAAHNDPDVREQAAGQIFISRALQSDDIFIPAMALFETTGKDEPAVIKILDSMLDRLWRGPKHGIARSLVDHLLLSEAASLAELDGVRGRIVTGDRAQLNALLADWIASGEEGLIGGLHDIVTKLGGKPPCFDLNFASKGLTFTQAISSARKVVSSLILFPETVASIILSLMRTGPTGARRPLAALLFDPMAISYWSLRDHLMERRESEPVEVGELIGDVLTAMEGYTSAIEAAGRIPELWPSNRQRFLMQTKRVEEQAASRESARKASFMDALMSRSVMLFGDSVITEVYLSDDEPVRQEFKLGQFEYSMEIARLEAIDPFGFWYQRVKFATGEKP